MTGNTVQDFPGDHVSGCVSRCLWQGVVSIFAALALVFVTHPVRAEHILAFHTPADVVTVSFEDLEALPRTSFNTSTVWTEQVDTYAGVLLKDLLRHFGIDPDAGPGRVQVDAIDGYSAVLDFDLVTDQAPLLAYHRNGMPMSRRDQGPLWLLFPFDDHVNFRTETIYAMSVWQVRSIRVLQP